MGPTVTRPVQDTLAVVLLDNRAYIERMVITYMQRKVQSRNKRNDKYTKVSGRMINIICMTSRR